MYKMEAWSNETNMEMEMAYPIIARSFQYVDQEFNFFSFPLFLWFVRFW